MALVLKNGAVFLHVPKTGGNWITAILEDLGLVDRSIAHKHADIDHFFAPFYQNKKSKTTITKYIFRNVFFPCTKKPFMFCFVRNPLSWYESWFKYMSQPKMNWQNFGNERNIYGWHPNSMLNGLGNNDFNAFIENVINKRPGFVTEMYGWYTRPQMDFIGKQENLADDFMSVLKIMDLEFDEDFIRSYKPVGVSPESDIVWDEGLKRKLAICEYAGLLKYGYYTTITDLGIK